MLAGSRVLVVEDEALIAMGISAMLTDAEAVPVGPASQRSGARPANSSGTSPRWTRPCWT